MRSILRLMIAGLLTAAVSSIPTSRAHAETDKVRIAIQYGLQYMPLLIVSHEKLIEKHVEAAGLPRPTVTWNTFSGGDVLVQALLSGQVDVINGGVNAFLTLWSKTSGKQKVLALAPFNSLPVVLVTRDPKIRSMKDYTENDKIAVPSLLSGNALLLQMEAEKIFGPGKWKAFDHLMISRGQPDAYAAFIDEKSGIASHFGNSPFTEMELKYPGARVVLTERDVLGGDTYSGGVSQTTRDFYEKNPKTTKAYFDALVEAMNIIKSDKVRAAKVYLEVTRDTKNTVENIVELLSNPHMIFDPTPFNIMKFADFMNRIGQLNQKPADWKELFLPYVHNLKGS